MAIASCLGLVLFVVWGSGCAEHVQVRVAVELAPPPAYTGPLRVGGTVILALTLFEEAMVTEHHTLSGMDPDCGPTFLAPSGSCAVTFHEGISCAEVGVALEFEGTAGGTNGAGADRVVSSTSFTGNRSRAAFFAASTAVVTDASGMLVACSPLASFFWHEGMGEGRATDWQVYPGYASNLRVEGTVAIYGISREVDGLPGQVLQLDFTSGLDPACVSPATLGGDACGIHVHEGHGCAGGGDIGGRFWDRDVVREDPWTPVRYRAGMRGLMTPAVVTGLELPDLSGRVLVMRDATGARVACAVIQGGVAP